MVRSFSDLSFSSFFFASSLSFTLSTPQGLVTKSTILPALLASSRIPASMVV